MKTDIMSSATDIISSSMTHHIWGL
uniref:Uncharacterized protein n=1 Tax=Arundo donax TaxID=35708 RepID=A0A0A8Y5G2_ARUDO